MFDVLFNVRKGERRPFEMIFVAFFYASISILLSFWIFPEYSSLISVFFTVMACLYVAQGAIRLEESKGWYDDEIQILQRHKKPLFLFLSIFVGVVLAFSVWSFALPTAQANELFEVQSKIVSGIRSNVVTGDAVGVGGSFFLILKNNLNVLLVSFIISLIYGAGAIFILVWNASVMGFVIGVAVKGNIFLFPVVLVKYFIHGIPEMLSYFMVILSGGMLYVAIIKNDLFDSIKRRKIFVDILILMVLAIVLMVVSALIEVFVSPII